MPSLAPARLQVDGCTNLLMGDLLTRVLQTADVDNMHKDIRTRKPGCHILTLTAATWLGWPLRILGSSRRMPAVRRPAVGRPGVGMPDQVFFRGLMSGGLIKVPDKGKPIQAKPDRRFSALLSFFFCANNKPAFGPLRCRPQSFRGPPIWACPDLNQILFARHRFGDLPVRARSYFPKNPVRPVADMGPGRFLRDAVNL